MHKEENSALESGLSLDFPDFTSNLHLCEALCPLSQLSARLLLVGLARPELNYHFERSEQSQTEI